MNLIVKHKNVPNQKSFMELVGNVKGKECIVIEDMIDTGV